MSEEKIKPRAVAKNFLAIFLPLSVLVSGILAVIYQTQVRADRMAVEVSDQRNVNLQAKIIASDFRGIVSDLMILARQNELEEMLASVPEGQQTLAKEYLTFANEKGIYDQIRFLDETGFEVVRVNFNNGTPRIVPEAELQSKATRYYFKETLKLKGLEVFISPLDLNVEHGQLEQPLKPMIRFGTPVLDAKGRKRGVVILNYLGERLLRDFNNVCSTNIGQCMLLNAEGYWLKGAKPEDEWGFMFPNRKDKTFGKVFPTAWQQISQSDSGQFETADGMFTFTTVYPLREEERSNWGMLVSSYSWKVVSYVSPVVLYRRSHQLLKKLLLLGVGLVVSIGIGTWLLARARVSRAQAQEQLRESTAKLLKLVEREDMLKRRLSSQICNSLDLDTILSTAVTEICQLLQIDRCQFFWRRQEFELSHEACDPTLSSRNVKPFDQIQAIAALGKNFVQQQLLRIDEVDEDSQLDAKSQNQLMSLGIQAVLAVWVHTQSGHMGVIVCFHSTSRRWSDNEVELLKDVADQLAIAIDLAQLYNQTRTAAVVATAQAEQLQHALQELQQTQSQLIQTEKMSSLGQLVAGVAHEINNPVNFIYGNVDHAQAYIQELLEQIRLYQECFPHPGGAIEEHSAAIDLDFLLEDLPKMLSSMKLGANRIVEIVRSLRNFSRIDEVEVKAVDLHEGIDSTLLILKHRLKPNGQHPGIEIVKEFGDLPPVECYAGQLNQVFMNILANAIDALEELKVEGWKVEGLQELQVEAKRVLLGRGLQELKIEGSNQSTNLQPTKEQPSTKRQPSTKKQSAPLAIRIRTEKIDGDFVRVQIADNGPGMPEDVKARLFDPFFTTKPVGKGTGLGLSISYEIVVNKHGGSLKCVSAPGQGTEFWIELPVRQGLRVPAASANQSESFTTA